MRKRLALVWAIVVLGLALMLPATTAAATYGQMKFVSGYCSGSGGGTVNATFKLTKYSGFHASRLVMVVKGQGYYNGGWHTELNIGSYFVNINTNGGYFFKDSFYFKPGHSGTHRIAVTGKIFDGSYLVATGNAKSGYCG